MPGSWNGWTNPPTNNVVFGNSYQVTGGLLNNISTGTPHYQTIFSTPTNIAAGSYTFLYSSGPSTNYWQNKWTNGVFTSNTITNLTLNGANDNSITLANNKYYVMNWENVGYVATRAIFMELSVSPVNITNVSHLPASPTANDEVTVTVTTSATPSAEEKIFVRYTTNSWTTSSTAVCSFTGTTGTTTIPAQNGVTVEYYVFSTTLASMSGMAGDDIDLVTIKLNNNAGTNYTYDVPMMLTCEGASGVLTTEPIFPIHDGSVVITFDATRGNGVLMNYAGDVYAHTGVITSESEGNNDWRYVQPATWGLNSPETKFTNIGTDLYQLTIPNIREFYDVPVGEEIYKIAMVIRADEPISPEDPNNFLVARNADGSDLHLEIYTEGINVKYIGSLDKDPLVPVNAEIPICIYALDATSIALKIDNIQVSQISDLHLMYGLNTGDYDAGMHEIIAIATDGTNFAYDTTWFYIRGEVVVQALPAGMKNGINYINSTSVTLVLNDPSIDKEFAFILGDFNNWTASDEGYMKRTPDGKYYWATITGLTAGTEYAYQYYIDGELKLADPYCDKILDPWNDRYIPETTYPNLKAYPWDRTLGTVSVLQPGQTEYDWVVDDFTPVAIGATQSNLIIYELLIRDFVESKDIKDVILKLDYLKSLGVNAIELMPIAEFDGNDSWGYAPNFYYATDKAYGTKNDYKQFIDECHQRDIAVILDVVYNHMYGGSPFVQMYWNSETNEPAANNAWFNTEATHPYSIGYDFNHESINTKNLIKDNLTYWLTEYKVDGFRFDLSKGFTQTNTGGDVGAWSLYDQSRINILTDYYNHIKSVNPDAYVILEHFANNDEEVVLANTGCMLWGVMTSQFAQNTMGWNSNHDLSWANYGTRSFNYPNLIPFMESHDEERIMFENITYGNGIANDTIASLYKTEAAVAIYMTIPGPKMIWQFGELGYDESIELCWDGSYSSDCRTSSKPIHWEYTENFYRQKLYWIYASMAKLKTENEAFRFGTFTQDNSGLGKRMWIAHGTMNVVVSANFANSSLSMTPGFQHSGTWYNFFTGESFDVSDPGGHSVSYNSGDYYVYTDVQQPKPYVHLIVNVKNQNAQNIEGANVTITSYGNVFTNSTGNADFLYGSNTTVQYTVSKTGYQTATGSINLTTTDLTHNVVLQPLDIAETETEKITVYPNPTNDFITINSDVVYDIYIYDVTGKQVKKQTMNATTHTLNVSDLQSGIYTLVLKNNDEINVKKIIIN